MPPADNDTLVPDRFGADATDEVPALDGYEDLGPLGRGGAAEVRRVRDPALNRVMAMKIIHWNLLGSADARARFVEEAQATAQLTHPAIIPVHSTGTLADGRLYFTMKEVEGRTLQQVIEALFQASDSLAWGQTPWGLTFRGLIATFHRVCEAVAYAHSRGVFHRDLKPANVMTGPFGEVHVMDWGLARVTARVIPGNEAPVVTARSSEDAHDTKHGSVAGTPHFMPPEQAGGDFAELGAQADVYALGAMLYTCLSGKTPYEGTAKQVLRAVLAGPPPSLAERNPTGPPVPTQLAEICARAMQRDPADRHADASALADAVLDWLEGARRRARALAVAASAAERLPTVLRLEREASELDGRAAEILAEVPAHTPDEARLESWRMQDRAAELRRQALMQRLEHEGLLHAALTHEPDLVEGHESLCRLYREDHRRAEQTGDESAAVVAETKLRRHLRHLPTNHPARREHLDYLGGDGIISLVTDPPGATVEVLAYRVSGRSLVARPHTELGPTPIVDTPLPMGSYLLVIRHPERAPVHYPVEIERQQRWSSTPPGERVPRPLRLPPPDALGPDDRFVPAGWYKAGEAGATQRIWVEDFVVRAHPVTNAEYLAFLDDLVWTGREELALRVAPRERGGHALEAGAMIYGRNDDGSFALQPDADGDVWLPDWPVFMVDWWGAVAYARWLGERDGLPWRLLGEHEWEKAARGVDGRAFPFGNHLEAAWCCMRHSHVGRPLPARVGDWPLDVGPYGVRHTAGNVRDWLGERFDPGGPASIDGRAGAPALPAPDATAPDRISERGGNWVGDQAFCRVARRYGMAPHSRDASLGFRVARSW